MSAAVQPLQPEGLMRPEDAAAWLGVSTRQLRRLVRDGLAYVAYSARCYRFRREDLQAWVDERVKQRSTSEAPSTGAGSPSPASGRFTEREKRIAAELSRPRTVSTRRLFLKRRREARLASPTDPPVTP